MRVDQERCFPLSSPTSRLLTPRPQAQAHELALQLVKALLKHVQSGRSCNLNKYGLKGGGGGDRGGVVAQLLETSRLYTSGYSKTVNQGVKQQRLRRLRKRYLKVKSRCFKLFRAFSISRTGRQMLEFFFVELNSKRLLGVREKKKKVVVSSSTKREIRHFHVVVLQ